MWIGSFLPNAIQVIDVRIAQRGKQLNDAYTFYDHTPGLQEHVCN